MVRTDEWIMGVICTLVRHKGTDEGIFCYDDMHVKGKQTWYIITMWEREGRRHFTDYFLFYGHSQLSEVWCFLFFVLCIWRDLIREVEVCINASFQFFLHIFVSVRKGLYVRRGMQIGGLQFELPKHTVSLCSRVQTFLSNLFAFRCEIYLSIHFDFIGQGDNTTRCIIFVCLISTTQNRRWIYYVYHIIA